MSSSEVKIIKFAKVSGEPVVISMQQFRELDVAGLERFDPEDPATWDDGNVLADEAEEEETEIPIAPETAIIQAARAEAQEILAAAQIEAEKQRVQAAQEGQKQGHATGHATGLQQGTEDGVRQGLDTAKQQMAEQLRQAAERSNSMVAAADQEVIRLLHQAEPKIIELVLAISRKIINDEVTERPAVVVNLVRSALERVRDQDKINIHVSPEDYDLVLLSRRELQAVVGAERSLNVSADAVLNRGGCLIETSFGTVEAGVDTQLEAVRQALLGLLP